MRRQAVVESVAAALIALSPIVLANCSSSSTTPDGGPGVGVPFDGGWLDGGPTSACGHPGDLGNSIGVGQYCTAQGTCPSAMEVCSTINNPVEAADLQTYFCVLPCSPCSAPSFCGEGASCVCSLQGCGCTPNACEALFLDAGTAACVPDGGESDAGVLDAGQPVPDAGPSGISCAALLGCQQRCASQVCNVSCLASATAVAQGLFGSLESCIGAACPGVDAGACAVPDSPSCSQCQTGAATGACVSELQTCAANTR